jgi:hypothetical protein
VALRTYADAFEFPVSGGDVLAAVTTGKAVTTALPDEPQGESLAYTADGAALLTVSETAGGPAGTRPKISRYASALPAAERPPAAATTAPAGPGSLAAAPARPRSTAEAAEPRRASSAAGMTAAGITVAGLVVLILLIVGLVRRHRRT